VRSPVALVLLLALAAACGSGGEAASGTTTSERPATTSATTTTTTAPAPTAPAPRGGADGPVVVVDPGHNGANGAHPEEIGRPVDAGGFQKACNTAGAATADGTSESSINWAVAQLVRAGWRRPASG
jgi:N-acetylmuramoyl-L-alanine amidase